MCDWARECGCHLGIARNRIGSIFMPNRECWMRSRNKIIKGALPGGDGILACVNGRANEVAVLESREIAPVANLGQITSIARGPTLKL